MDPVTQFLAVAAALIKFAQTIAEGQTPEQRKIIWDWIITDIAWWRKHLGIEK